ncbi:hypothetical protein SOCEGT47_069120 [Sorangium cellulosum]|uniref:Secreted protein n=1 Tax=Sorangium cellulosum TaxID=56 RepID=A0A4P2QAN1_SORCE|nr:DUF1592 domain-containing protein [Sorangium cellulosum]AUX26351.1 hypothetical protein SOCEGT47_069120 [Sorangium cellulosum]
MDRSTPRILLVALALSSAAACSGESGDADDPAPVDDPGAEIQCAPGVTAPGPTPRLTRLTHAQYDNTIRDLFGKDMKASAAFLADPAFDGFDNNAKALTVSDRLARDYRRAAETIAEGVVADRGVLDRILPCAPEGDGEACARQLIQGLGKRVYRRPLSAAQEEAYAAAYRRGDGLFEAGTPFEQGVRHVIEAMLQSPHFLYRVELSEALNDERIIPLDGYEVATRLSYLLWNSTPDDALLARAESGALGTPEGIEVEARRMLEDPRAASALSDFHDQWLHLSRYDDLSKDPALYPGFDAGVSSAMKAETREFIRHVILEMEADYATLMTEPVGFVNDRLAPIYGVEGSFSGKLVRTPLDPAQRAGLLTQAGFLSAHAFFDKTSPIHRGVFLQRQILCATLPDPPANIDTTLPPIAGEIRTTRDQVEAHTSPDACNKCHAMINPAGFAFEHYDAVGRHRADEDGEAIDPTGELQVGGATIRFDGAVDLVTQLAESPVAERCYLTNWYRYANARQLSREDTCTIDALDAQLRASGYNIKELLVSLTQTKTFRFRAVEEVEQ